MGRDAVALHPLRREGRAMSKPSMPKLNWSMDVEGPVVLMVASAGLLIYGYYNEDIFTLSQGALPAFALLVVVLLSAVDLLFNRKDDHAVLQEYEATGEGYMTVPEMIVACIISIIYTIAMIRIGFIVSSTAFVALLAWYLAGKVSIFYACVALIISSLLWLCLNQAGSTFFGNPLLF